MCMRYETAAILFHEEDGDFSLWTVDMPSEIVDEARKQRTYTKNLCWKSWN